MAKKIWLKSVTAEMLSKVEVTDWLEGYGDVLSFSQRNYIRKYGFLLLEREAKIKQLIEEQWDFQERLLKTLGLSDEQAAVMIKIEKEKGD